MPTNHPAAEVYEVLVTLGLGDYFGIETNVSNELVQTKVNLAEDRAEREIQRAPTAVEKLSRYLNALGEDGKPVAITWTGGGAGSSFGTAADLEIEVADGRILGFQLKSVGTGLGTMRNPYNDVLMKRVGADSSSITRAALSDCLGAIEGYLPKGQKPTSFAQLFAIRKAMEKNEKRREMELLAKEAYEPVKLKLCQKFTDAFNSLDPEARATLMTELMGVEEGSSLTLVVHDEKQCRILSHHGLVETLREFDLNAKVKSANSLLIGSGNKDYFRLNSSAANGQGISPPAWRIFYCSDSETLLKDLAES